jgi:hypothetical protein
VREKVRFQSLLNGSEGQEDVRGRAHYFGLVQYVLKFAGWYGHLSPPLKALPLISTDPLQEVDQYVLLWDVPLSTQRRKVHQHRLGQWVLRAVPKLRGPRDGTHSRYLQSRIHSFTSPCGVV